MSVRIKWFLKEHRKIIILGLLFLIFVTVLLINAVQTAKAADVLEEFQLLILDTENTVYEYELRNLHIPSYEETVDAGVTEEPSEVIWLEAFVKSMENDKSKKWESMDDLGGGSTFMYVTVTAKDGSVLYAEILGDNCRYILTTPDGEEYRSIFKCNELYLRSFLIAHDCNDG